MTGGFWASGCARNRERTLPHGFESSIEAGNLENFRLAAGTATGGYRALGIMFDGLVFPFLDSDVYKWLEARRPGSSGGRGTTALAAIGRRGDRARGRGAARRRLPQQVRPGRRRRAASTATSNAATSCTASAISSRRRSPGTARSATTGCWPWPGARPTRVDAALGPGAPTGSTAIPRSRWRWSSCTGSTGEAPLPRARPPARSIAAATAGSGPGGSARPTGRTIEPVREASGVAGHAVRQLYLDAARSTWPSRPATRRCSTPSTRAGGT